MESERQWIERQIINAESGVFLDALGSAIRQDSEGGFDYTRDEAFMKHLRGLFVHRKKELESEGNDD